MNPLVYRKACALLLTSLVCTAGFAQDRGVGVSADGKSLEGNYNHIYAVVVGISQYQDKNLNLHYADKDARLFAQYLQAAYPEKLRLYDNLKLLVDSVATSARIDHDLKWLKESCKPGDLAIIYFAGHGGVAEVGGDMVGFLLGYNANKEDLNAGGALRMTDLDNDVNKVIATRDGASVLCVFDACHAGTSKLFFTSNAEINRRFIDDQGSGNVMRILSCNSTQSSMEKDKLCGGEGVFTYYLVKALLSDTGRMVSLRDVRNYLEKNVEAETNRNQTPQMKIENSNTGLRAWRPKDAAVAFACLVGDVAQTAPVGQAPSVPQARVPVSESDYLANRLSDLQKEHYKEFAAALAQKKYLGSDHQNALYYYQQLEVDGLDKPILEQIKTQWKVRFEDYAQSLIVDYVNERNIARYSDYENAALMLGKCIDYSTRDDPDYNKMLSRKIWLECYSSNYKMLKGLVKISQNEERGIRLGLIEKLKGAIAIDTSAAYLRNTLGSLYEMTGNNEAAISTYWAAVRLAPRWTYPRINLSNVLFKWKDKIAELDSCVVLNPNMHLAYVNLGYRYRVEKKFDLAENKLDLAKKVCLEKGLGDNDDMAAIYKQYGYLYQARGMKEQAEKNFLKAIELFGDSASSYRVALADFYSSFKEFEKSKAELDKALTINPNDAELYGALAYRAEVMGRRDEAINWYRKALALDSMEDDYHYHLAYLYRSKGAYAANDPTLMNRLFDSAGRELDKGLALDSSNSSLLSEKAYLSGLMKDSATAEKYYAKCLDVSPNSSFVYYSMSFFNKKRDLDKAISYIRKAIDIEAPQEDGDYYIQLSALEESKGVYDQALYYAFKAVAVDPRTVNFQLSISDVYNEMKKPDSALFYMDKAVETELIVQNVQPGEAVEFFKKKIKEEQWKFYYYCLGSHYEKLWLADKKKEDLSLAIRWYTYAGNLISDNALTKLKQLDKITGEKRSDLSATIARLTKVYAGYVKAFYVPCSFPDGTRETLPVYINDYPANPAQVLEEEGNRIWDVYQARIADSSIDYYNKLYQQASANKVSFVEYCITGNTGSFNTSAKKEHAAESENFAGSVSEEVQLIYDIKHGKTANLTARMRQLILKRTGVDLDKFDDAVRRIKDSLRVNDGMRNLIYYYALGYLYEQTPGRQDLGQARKWYGYAFQMGYSPAYYKLDSLYRYLSKSKVDWLKDNYEAEYYAITIPVEENADRFVIYLMEYPPDDANPVGHEADRLKEVYGVTIKATMISALNNLYVSSGTSRIPFVSYVEYAIYLNGKDSLNPDKTSLWYWWELGNKRLKEKNYPEAIGLFNKALEINPRNTTALNDLALAFIYNKQYDEGLACFDKMIAIDRRTAALVYYNTACSYSLRNMVPEALKYLEKAFAAGYRDMKNVQADEDLINIRNTEAFKALVKKYSH